MVVSTSGRRFRLGRFCPPGDGQGPHPTREPAAHRAPGGAALRAPALIARGTRGGAELAPAAVAGVREPLTVLVVSGFHQTSTAPVFPRLTRPLPPRPRLFPPSPRPRNTSP